MVRRRTWMGPAWGILLAACGADGVHAPESTAVHSVTGVAARATGSAHFIANGELRKFTFSAVTHADGSVSGQFELVAGNADLVAHGTVTCMTVIGNEAWVGGTLDRNSVGAPFTHGWWRAEDQSPAGAADGISLLVVANNPGGSLVQAFCDDTPAAPALNPVIHGNISID